MILPVNLMTPVGCRLGMHVMPIRGIGAYDCLDVVAGCRLFAVVSGEHSA